MAPAASNRKSRALFPSGVAMPETLNELARGLFSLFAPRMASYPPYIPPSDSLFAGWLANFDALLTAAPATYGLTAPDAVAVAAPAAAFAASYPISQDPATRSPVTVAQKDVDRASAEAVVRPFAVAISRNQAVLDADKTAIGVTVPSLVPTPIPAPTSMAVLGIIGLTPGVAELNYKESGAVGKSKPFGVVGVEIRAAVGVAHTVDPEAATYVGDYTKSPFRLAFGSEAAGSKLTVFARFKTRSGPAGKAQVGPWSAPLQTIVV